MVSTSSEGTPAEPPTSSPPPNLPEESRASRRLTILTEGRWTCDEDRDHVLKMLCEAMAQDRLGKPFWALKYQVNPISQTVEDSGTIHYKVLISRQDEAQQVGVDLRWTDRQGWEKVIFRAEVLKHQMQTQDLSSR